MNCGFPDNEHNFCKASMNLQGKKTERSFFAVKQNFRKLTDIKDV
jgi:hypothetical protein